LDRKKARSRKIPSVSPLSFLEPAHLFLKALFLHLLSVSTTTRMVPMNSNSSQNQARFIRLEQVKARTGLSRSTLYAYIREGRFPSPVTISTRCVAWVESEIDDWISKRIVARRSV
jgi:prophage regulatory protein